MAGKYKKGLVNEVKADIAYEKEQEKLKEKYNLDEDVVVVEKSNAYKFTITVLINVIKTLATIIILILAAIGLITLIYPTTREAVLQVLYSIKDQAVMYLR